MQGNKSNPAAVVPLEANPKPEYDFFMTTTDYLRTTIQQRREIEHFDSRALGHYQLELLNRLLETVIAKNAFYSSKLGELNIPLESLDRLSEIPYTFKDELLGYESSEGFAANLTFPIDEYSRFHRTSGTRGRPMIVLDTKDDWQWWMETWQYVLDSAGLQATDRVVMAFSFGPFIGFWSLFWIFWIGKFKDV